MLNLRGFSIHEQNLQTGAALSPQPSSPTWSAGTASWAAASSAPTIRSTREIEEMADRDGILLWSEVPVYQVDHELPHAHRAG